MTSEIESRGLIFELQWKKKPGLVNKEEDIASLGIWDTADPSLDWSTFKSYLSQNLGTPEDISAAYVDSEGDELPIESECEFQEALKFARERSRKGRKIVLKVDKQESPASSAADRAEKKRWLKHNNARGIKLSDKFNHSFDFVQPKLVNLPAKADGPQPIKVEFQSKQVLKRDLEDFQKHYAILLDKMERMTKLGEERGKLDEDRRKKSKTDKDELPPPWFKKYMQKMKKEIVAEVTANTQQMITSMVPNAGRSGEKSGGGYLVTRVKKRNSDEDSSDAALGSDQRDHKLLRKIEKLHKREKKLEKKLDTKLEKLENKTKRIMEKKLQSKPLLERERVPEKKTRKRSNDGPVGTYLMDANLLNDGPKAETHIKLGKRFTKIWEIMNNGTLPWTDKTELRLAWGTLGLEPEEPNVKCPILEPGEKGQIAVNFRAPDFPGTFESYWHFYHMGERFGHWIGCAVVVEEPNKGEKTDVGSAEQKSKGAVKKPNRKSGEQSNEDKQERLDNIASSKMEINPDDMKRLNDATNSHHLHNIETETNRKGDIAVDLSTKSKSEQISNLLCNLPNNNNINESPEQKSEPADGRLVRGPEYESDSDDDNLSVVSGTGPSSESEDEDFVVVHMPACFLRDRPLGSESVPVVVKESSSRVSTAEDVATGELRLDDQKVPACSVTDGSDDVTGRKRPASPCNPVKTEEGKPVLSPQGSGGSFKAIIKTKEGKPVVLPQGSGGSFKGVLKNKDGKVVANIRGTSGWKLVNKDGQHVLCPPATSGPSEQDTNNMEEIPVSITQATGLPSGSESGDGAKSPFFCFSASSINKATTNAEGQADREEAKSENTESPDDSENNYSSTTSFEATEKWWDSEDFKSDVYAVDSKGSCVPVATAWPADETTKIPLGFATKPSTPKQDKKHKCASGTGRFRVTTKSSPPSSVSYSFSKTYSSSQSHTASSSPRASSRGGVFDFAAPRPADGVSSFAAGPSHAASFPNDPRGPDEGAVHILPETIVNGAINVASSAFSTAKAVLSNLRAKPPGEGNGVIFGTVEYPGGAVQSTTTGNLTLLSEMGFTNSTLNVLLLQRFNNDVGKVVAELLLRQSL